MKNIFAQYTLVNKLVKQNMRLLIIAISFLVAFSTTISAQNANRSGVFLELQGGSAIGDVLQYRYDYMTRSTYLKGGVTGSIELGYRFATSTHLSADAKLGLFADLAEFKHTYSIRLMPGIRWISNDFGNALSLYVSFNAGVGVAPGFYTRLSVPLELSLGLNFTSHLYGGIFINYQINTKKRDVKECGYVFDNKPTHANWGSFFKDAPLTVCTKSFPSCGIRIGYKF